MDVNFYIDRLLLYFHISTITELAEKLGVAQQSISSWRQRNSVSAIKKKCMELGIYNDIFGDLNNTLINNYQGSNISGIGQNFGESEQTINKSPLCVEIEKMDSSIVAVFVDVYRKMEKEKNLKELFEVLGKLKFS